MNPFAASLIRTIVPIVAGSILSALTKIGLNIDVAGQEALSTLIDSAFIGGYYLIVRLIETKIPQVGWLLGLAKSPDSYSKDPEPVEGPRHLA